MSQIFYFIFKSLLLIGISFFVTGCSAEQKKHTNEPVKMIDFYGGDTIPLIEIVTTEIKAKRKPVLFFTADWCGPCREFKHSITDPLMMDALQGITLIVIDMDSDMGQISEGYNVHEIPTFIHVNFEGKIIQKMDANAWDENTPESMAPAFQSFQSNPIDLTAPPPALPKK